MLGASGECPHNTEGRCDYLDGADVLPGLKGSGSVYTHLKLLPPDLVLLDLCLNGFEGFEVLREIKRQKADLPVIKAKRDRKVKAPGRIR